jgi:hypothetical protein
MDRAAEVISIDDLRRRRALRDAARAAATPERRPAMTVWVPVWVAWVPVWRAASAPAFRRAAGWGAR